MPRPNGRPPGLIFFNHRGDECGGLIFDENGGKGHFISLTLDKSRQDQTVGLTRRRTRSIPWAVALALFLVAGACAPSSEPIAFSLVDHFAEATVAGTMEGEEPERTEWPFSIPHHE